MIQSLIKDFQNVADMMEQGTDATSTLAMMEQQTRLLSDISYDCLNAAATTAGLPFKPGDNCG